MKIAVIGASAGVGLLATKYALERGHDVVTLSRGVESLPEHPRLRKICGDATKLQDMQVAISDADAILVTLGTGTSKKATMLCADSAKQLLKTLQEVHRQVPLIVLSAFGVADSNDYYSFIARTFVKLLLKDLFADKATMERLIAASNQQWEIVRPGMLTNGALTGRYRIEPKLRDGMKIGSISRSDVAHFMVSQAEKQTCLRQYPSLTD